MISPAGSFNVTANAGNDAPGDGASPGDRHLLTDHRPDRRLVRVDARRSPAAGDGGDQCRERRIGAERRVDGGRVTVQVEQPTDALHGNAQVRP